MPPKIKPHLKSKKEEPEHFDDYRKTIEVITKDFSPIEIDCSRNVERFTNLFTIPNATKILCLDYHGVVDLYPENIKICDLPICIISYVSYGKEYHSKTRDSIIRRIESKQAVLGILVFRKIKQKDINANTNFCASKQDAVKFIILANNPQSILFCDDQQDNITTVEPLQKQFGDKEICCELLSNSVEPIETLNDIILKFSQL
jgi:hypothetical protein